MRPEVGRRAARTSRSRSHAHLGRDAHKWAPVTAPAAASEVAVQTLQDLGSPPMQLGERQRAKRRADVVADEALVGRPRANPHVVPGKPTVEQNAEAGLGARRLQSIGLSEQPDQRPLSLAPGRDRVAQDDAFTRRRVDAGSHTNLKVGAMRANTAAPSRRRSALLSTHEAQGTTLGGQYRGQRSSMTIYRAISRVAPSL